MSISTYGTDESSLDGFDFDLSYYPQATIKVKRTCYKIISTEVTE